MLVKELLAVFLLLVFSLGYADELALPLDLIELLGELNAEDDASVDVILSVIENSNEISHSKEVKNDATD